jgi:hypothetical protein
MLLGAGLVGLDLRVRREVKHLAAPLHSLKGSVSIEEVSLDELEIRVAHPSVQIDE